MGKAGAISAWKACRKVWAISSVCWGAWVLLIFKTGNVPVSPRAAGEGLESNEKSSVASFVAISSVGLIESNAKLNGSFTWREWAAAIVIKQAENSEKETEKRYFMCSFAT